MCVSNGGGLATWQGDRILRVNGSRSVIGHVEFHDQRDGLWFALATVRGDASLVPRETVEFDILGLSIVGVVTKVAIRGGSHSPRVTTAHIESA